MTNNQKTINNEQIYRCPECGMHYRDKKLVEACQAYCRQYNACSLELARQSVENSEGLTNES